MFCVLLQIKLLVVCCCTQSELTDYMIMWRSLMKSADTL